MDLLNSEKIDRLSRSVSQTLELSKIIASELDEHQILINDLDERVDNNIREIDEVSDKVMSLKEKVGTWSLLGLLCIFVIIDLILLILILKK